MTFQQDRVIKAATAWAEKNYVWPTDDPTDVELLEAVNELLEQEGQPENEKTTSPID